MSDTEFVDGLLVKPPRDKAPDYVKASLSMKREALIAWLQSRDGEWINLDIKEGRSGKWYAAVDTWKPSGQQSGQRHESSPPQRESPPRSAPPVDNGFTDDEIPF